MSALFPPWSNTAVRLVLVLVALGAAGTLWLLIVYTRLPYFTNQQNVITQPIEFDHRHHAGDDRIDCRYCHYTVETSARAGIPPTALCMSCHSQVWNNSALTEPLRAGYFGGTPIVWRRVHQLPDFAYFNHAIHVAKGVGCVTCHGRVDEMARVVQVSSLQMGWCLECHRNPTPHLRPRWAVARMDWQPSAGSAVPSDVHTRTSCTACHR